jgi:asparagine synthase (glutamine-hydrolysing)
LSESPPAASATLSSDLELGAPIFAAPVATWSQALSAGAPADAAARTRGTFAVARSLDDGSRFLAVDRFAQETLCWAREGDEVRVAERADAFGARELDPQAIHDYLFFHMIPAPRTIYRGVQRLPAGHWARIAGAHVDIQRHDGLKFAPDATIGFDDAKQEFRHLMEQAVRAQLEPGVPACFLSGGTDSSTVAGHIRKIAGEVHTYSIGFDAQGYDEMAYARLAAQHFGATHHEYYVTPDDLVQHIARVAGSYDQPFGNSSALPAYCCALRAREDGVSKLIAGDGGDELFGGNTRYAEQGVFAHWARVPAVLRRGLIEPILALPGAQSVNVVRKGRNYVRAAQAGLPDRLHAYNLLERLGPEQVLEPAFLRAVDRGDVQRRTREVWALADADNDIDRMLAYDWRYTLADSDLPKVRGTSRLAGVKVGYPMLDDALVDFSMRLPANYKVRGKQLRWFFKEALRDFLPEAIITKPKKGFGLPFGVWAMQHAPLHALATDSVRAFATRGVVRESFVRELIEERLPQHPGYYGEMVWILMMLEQWLRRHLPDWRMPRDTV